MIDTANCITDVLYRLGFQGAGDIAAAGTWVTVNELYAWADEAVKALAAKCGLFVNLDTSITASSGTAVYNLPANHVYTLQAWLGTGALRITPQQELWALDTNFPATSGPATRACFDASSVGTLTLYPNPTTGGTVSQLAQEFPADIAVGSSTVQLPTVLQGYLSLKMLVGARGKESEAAMPEMLEHFEKQCALYEAVIEHLYGSGL